MRITENKTDNGIITDKLPRMDDTKKTYSRIKCVNSTVSTKKVYTTYVKTDAVFEGRLELFQRNGILHDARGIACLGILLCTEVEKFFNTRNPATRGPQNSCVQESTGISRTGYSGTQETIETSEPENNGT